MTQAELYAYLRKHRYAVISTMGVKSPQAAIIGIAVTENLDIIFDTLTTSRKYINLRANPNVALVIGLDGAETVQYEGLAEPVLSDELDACKRDYFATFPDGRERERWKHIAYIRVRPRWVRYSDFSVVPPRIEELRLKER